MLKKLHAHLEQKQYVPSLRVLELEKENRLLRKQLEEKDTEIINLKQEIQDLHMRVSELADLLFKRKKSKRDNDDNQHTDTKDAGLKKEPGKKRSKASYRRQPPPDDEVTKEEEYTLESCAACGSTNLEEIDKRTIYIEDIPLIIKEVIKKIIHIYVCADCRQAQTAHPIPRGQTVLVGPRVKQFVLYATYILNVSFRDITRTLKDYFHLELSNGEIKHILKESAKNLTPHYNGIQDELLEQEAVNADETSWKIRGEKYYLWGLCSPTTQAVLFHIGSRGKGNIEKLLRDFRGCLTSDCYAAYKNLTPLIHQICWVHILRNVKDLCADKWLTQEQKQSAQDLYDNLSVIYQNLKEILLEPFDEQKRKRAQQQYLTRLQEINQLLPCDTAKKLKNIKLLTQEYEHELFACLAFTTALPENNLAERNLRHVVLKRKQSFGSQSEKGAHIFAINASVVLTFWKKFPNTFFLELGKVLGY